MSKVIFVSPSRLVTDPARNPRFANAPDPAAAARKFYNSEQYAALCESFKASGITIPLFVTKRKGGYLVIEGFSRAHWAKRQMKKDKTIKVPVTVMERAKDARTAAVAMNTARVAFDPIARAGSFQSLVEEWGSIEQAAKRAGVNVGTVRETLRLLRLPLRAQKMIQSGKLSVPNANKIMRLPGWKAYQQYKDNADVPAKTRRESDDFLKRVMAMLDTMRQMDDVPDVGSAWNKQKRRKKKNAESTDDIAIVLPTIESLREACFQYGRKLARLFLSGKPDQLKYTRYKAGIEHLAATMGWCVPKSLESTLTSIDGTPLYSPAISRALRREVVNEYVLCGVIEIARRDGRAFDENDELLDDANWQNFFKQNAPLETLVQRLNRRLK